MFLCLNNLYLHERIKIESLLNAYTKLINSYYSYVSSTSTATTEI